jgi:hypothetical protein
MSLIALSVSGCGNPDPKMYPGPEVSPDKRAAIQITQWEKVKFYETKPRKAMFILSVDGRKTGNGFRYPAEVYVLPGKHNMTVQVVIDNSYITDDICLEAQAGKIYIVRYLAKGYGGIIWFEDQQTGRPVEDCTSRNEP